MNDLKLNTKLVLVLVVVFVGSLWPVCDGALNEIDLVTLTQNNNAYLIDKLLVLVVLPEKVNLASPVKTKLFEDLATELNKTDETIQVATIKDPEFGKLYGILKFPQLFFYRDGNFVIYKGDLGLNSSTPILEWIETTTEKKTRRLNDANFEHDTQV